MTAENGVPLDRTRNHALTEIYYDTNSYIAGAIETLPEVRNHPHYLDITRKLPDEAARRERRVQELAMATLLTRWNPQRAFLSVYTLLEALDVATRRYGLPVEQVLGIVVEGIDRDFTLLPAEFDMVRPGREIVQQLEAKIPRSWEFARVRYRAMARDSEGRELGTVSMSQTLTSGAGSIEMRSGSPETFKSVQSLDAPQWHTIRDPKFERELFLGAAQIAVEYGVHATDALHVLICMGKCSVLVTNDGKLLGRFPRVGANLPHALTPTRVLRTWGRFLDPPVLESATGFSTPAQP